MTAAGQVYLTGATLLDPATRRRVDDGVLGVRDGVITAVAARADLPDTLDGEEHRLSGYLLPGLFNCHAHLALDGDDTPYVTKLPVLTALPEDQRVLGYLEQARTNLAWGVTSVRDLHPGPAGELSGYALLRTLADHGAFPAARLFVANRPLVIAAGHGTHWMSRIVSGVDEVVRAVRETVRDGADVIKLMTAHAWGPLPDEPGSWGRYFHDEELRAAVGAAHDLGVPVAAHCHGGPALRSVIEAGVDSVEHGSGLTEELAAMMAERGTHLVPTLASYDTVSRVGERGGLTAHRVAQAGWVRQRQRDSFAAALAAGVRIAAGSDAGFHMLRHGESLVRELELYAELGMPTWDVLASATSVAAGLVGVADQLGSLTVGHKADVVVATADPVADVSALRDLAAVFVGGVRHDPAALRAPLVVPGVALRPLRRTFVDSDRLNRV